MASLNLSDLEKRFIDLGIRQFRQEQGYRGQVSFTQDTVVLPERTLATLLARGYSAIRIRMRPTPEVYVLEANMRVKCEKGRDCWKASKDPEDCVDCSIGCSDSCLNAIDEPLEMPDGLAKYLQGQENNKDTLLNRFRKKGQHTEISELAGVTYYVFGELTFPFKDRTRKMQAGKLSGFADVRQRHSGFIYIHTHPGGRMWQSPGDLLHGMVQPLQGILDINHIAFAKFVMQQKPEDGLIQLTYKRKKGTESGYFIPAKRIHKLAREYSKKIVGSIENYVKDRGMPIIMWETCDDGNIRFFERYRIG